MKKTLAELLLPCQVLWIRRESATIPPRGASALRTGDLLRVGAGERELH